MTPIPVDSSCLDYVDYDINVKIMTLTFDTGHIYEYDNVDEEVYVELLSAESKGKYFNAYIRRSGYKYRRIE